MNRMEVIIVTIQKVITKFEHTFPRAGIWVTDKICERIGVDTELKMTLRYGFQNSVQH